LEHTPRFWYKCSGFKTVSSHFSRYEYCPVRHKIIRCFWSDSNMTTRFDSRYLCWNISLQHHRTNIGSGNHSTFYYFPKVKSKKRPCEHCHLTSVDNKNMWSFTAKHPYILGKEHHWWDASIFTVRAPLALVCSTEPTDIQVPQLILQSVSNWDAHSKKRTCKRSRFCDICNTGYFLCNLCSDWTRSYKSSLYCS
jgi:hypothetical protein